MSNYSVTVTTAVQAEITQCVYLVELGFSVPVRFASTRHALTVLSHEWVPADMDEPRLNYGAFGLLEGDLVMGNAAGDTGAMLLREGTTDRSCQIWSVHGQPPYSDDACVRIFNGFMDGCEWVSDVAWRIYLKGASSEMSLFPPYLCAPPLVNHLWPAGTVLNWGGSKYTIEERR